MSKLISKQRYHRFVGVFWALVGQAGQTLLQLLYFIVVARVLGADQTGLFFLVVSVSLIGSSFVGLGAGGIVLREVSRNQRDSHHIFAQARFVSYVSFAILFTPVVIISFFVTECRISIFIISLIVISDLLASRLLTTCWSLFIAKEEQMRAALLICTMPLTRIAMCLPTAAFPAEERLAIFSSLYFLASVLVAAAVQIYVIKRVGSSPLKWSNYDLKGGFSFSLTWLNATIQNESDKVLLGLLGTPSMVAVYSIASRLMDGASVPPRVLRVYLQARLFRAGSDGGGSAYRLSLRFLPAVCVYGFVCWFAFWLAAPFVPMIFGASFNYLSHILPILGILPLLRGISEFAAEIFMSSDKPQVQAIVQSLLTICRIVLGYLLISKLEIDGAVYNALLVTLTSAIVLWTIATFSARRQTK